MGLNARPTDRRKSRRGLQLATMSRFYTALSHLTRTGLVQMTSDEMGDGNAALMARARCFRTLKIFFKKFKDDKKRSSDIKQWRHYARDDEDV